MPFIEGLVQLYWTTETSIACVSHGGLYWMMLPVVLSNVNTALIERYGLGYMACIETERRGEELFCVTWNPHAQKPGRGQVGRLLEQANNPDHKRVQV